MSDLTDALGRWDSERSEHVIRRQRGSDDVDLFVDAARRVVNAQAIVDEQAEDEALWFIDVSAPEAYLQQALRRLHAAIDQEDE